MLCAILDTQITAAKDMAHAGTRFTLQNRVGNNHVQLWHPGVTVTHSVSCGDHSLDALISVWATCLSGGQAGGTRRAYFKAGTIYSKT